MHMNRMRPSIAVVACCVKGCAAPLLTLTHGNTAGILRARQQMLTVLEAPGPQKTVFTPQDDVSGMCGWKAAA
jgi:hypothetical protein